MTGGRRSSRRAAVRLVAGAFAGSGAALLARPGTITRVVCSGAPQPPAWVVRLLGGRLVLQHTTVLLHPTRGPVLAGVATDAVHLLSMAGVAACWRAYRRPAVAGAMTAAGSLLLGVLTAPPADR